MYISVYQQVSKFIIYTRLSMIKLEIQVKKLLVFHMLNDYNNTLSSEGLLSIRSYYILKFASIHIYHCCFWLPVLRSSFHISLAQKHTHIFYALFTICQYSNSSHTWTILSWVLYKYIKFVHYSLCIWLLLCYIHISYKWTCVTVLWHINAL